MAGPSEIKEEYTSSLQDLTFNSKPLISVLTILAEENVAHAKDIVEAIEAHLARVTPKIKLPVLYLIDCIIKNVGEQYTTLFCQNIVSTFCSVFEQVDERTRSEMFKLRQTWNDVIPQKKLYALDVQIAQLDPAWPVTAPPPNNIHFNPKFLKTTTSSVASVVGTSPTISKSTTSQLLKSSSANANPLDPKTLTMQQRIINKQRELLELQQRKLELELLHTQVKLQEQMKTQNNLVTAQSNTTTTPPQNLLLKPEVAKQLSSNIDDMLTKSKKSVHPVSTLSNSRFQGGGTGNTKISPVSGSLVNATRPVIRDPRLLRHQQQQGGPQIPNSSLPPTASPTSAVVENKSKIGIQQSLDSENNKIVNNSKSNVRNDRVIEQRLVNNNNKGNIESKSKTLPHSSSPLKHTQKIGSSPRRKIKCNRDSKLSSGDLKSSSSSIDNKGKKVSNNSSGDVKDQIVGSKIPKFKKRKDISSSRSSSSKDASDVMPKVAGNPGRYLKDTSSDSVRDSKKSEKHSKCVKDDDKFRKSDVTFFKDLKGSTKNRNYVRRNQGGSNSPESSQDIDFRTGGPPEKATRVQTEIIDVDTNETCSQSMDVDFRQMPSTIRKKRPSTEISNEPIKKSKTEMFDALFGTEDTDLRQLPNMLSPQTNERPPTPPPPIISEKNNQREESSNETTEKVEKPDTTSFDALRAKLANAINRDKMQDIGDDKQQNTPSDLDLRKLSQNYGSNDESTNNLIQKIPISPADQESIETGNMTLAQRTALMNKIVARIETQKLREAQRRESESVSNISLQPISDDELEPDFSGSDSDEGKPKSGNVNERRIDRPKRETARKHIHNEREPFNSQTEENFSKFPRIVNFRGEPRRGRAWRLGRQGRIIKAWETVPPPLRPQFVPPPHVEAWVRPPQPEEWRMTTPAPFPNNQLLNDLVPHVMDQRSQSPHLADIPALEYVHPDTYKSITIDGKPREIRYYDEIAVIFIEHDDARLVNFQDGIRRIYFDDEFYTLHFNHPYEEILIKGNRHQVRFGGPSREIFIDGKGYECYFDEREKIIELDGNTVVVKLEPPPPQVVIGRSRSDLVLGKIRLIVDATHEFSIYVDAKIQTIEIDSVRHTLQFVDALRGVLIDDVKYEFEYGGLPQPVILNNRKHFFRFSALPRNVKPGHVRIHGMDGFVEEISDLNQNSSNGFEPPASEIVPCNASPNSSTTQATDSLDMLSTVMAMNVRVPDLSDGGYKVENDTASEPSAVSIGNTNTNTGSTLEGALPPVNINELFQKLVATGMLDVVSNTKEQTTQPSTTKNVKNFKPVLFEKPETLKIRQKARISCLYVGMQCSSCGMRFPPEQTVHYSQHLDWHFRQNRKGKKNIRKASSRHWYYLLSDWKNYEEIEDLEEREKSYFESQHLNTSENVNEEAEEETEIPCVSADPEVQIAVCDVCQDRFEQFYNEEIDEWQLRKAIRVEGKTYHPLCYEDYKKSLERAALDEAKSETIPGLESLDESTDTRQNEEDDVMEVIDNIDDEDEEMLDVSKPAEEETVVSAEIVEEEEDDDDVIINEVIPEKIVINDDDQDNYEPNEDDNGLIPGVVVKVEPIDDGFMDVENGLVKLKGDEVKIKTEPIDDDDEVRTESIQIIPVIEEDTAADHADTTHIEVLSSMDGNVDFETGTNLAPLPSATSLNTNKIKINITKPLPTIINKDNKEIISEEPKIDRIDPSQPLPPGEEPVQLNIKPTLKGLDLKRQPTVVKGSELTGLCSIM